MEEELIEAVRSRECLYDVKHPDYTKLKLKNSIWKEIAKRLRFKDGREAKRAWEKLRNNHRDALRRQKKFRQNGSGSAYYIKPWRFQDSMAFIIPHLGTRFSTSIREEVEHDEPSHAHSDTTEVNIQEYLMDHQDSVTDNEESNQSSETPSTIVSNDQVHKRRGHKRNALSTTSSQNRWIEERQHRAADRRCERKNDYTVYNVKNDPLFHFFISMYETTKRLPPLSQHAIKTNIFSLVSQEESTNLIKCSPRPHCSNAQNSCEEIILPIRHRYSPPVQQQLSEPLPVETASIITN